jgi:hypothetical protein
MPRVTVLAGLGGSALRPANLTAAQQETPRWSWRVLGQPPLGTWVADPVAALREADVVITHAGQNAIAEVAATRRPAVVIPQRRPHAEQEATARALAAGRWPVTVLGSWPETGWERLLAEAGAHDGRQWEAWCDGGAARRFAEVVERVAGRAAHRATA